MIPVSDTPPLKAQSPHKRHYGHYQADAGGKLTATKSCFLGLGRHQCALLLFLLLSLKLLLTFLPSPTVPLHRLHHDDDSHSSSSAVQCSSGKVFVYDLPAAFNQDLIGSCDELNPWASRCVVLPNGGFGTSSTDLAGVVPDSLLPYWYATDQFSGEIIYHRRMLSHRCRTNDSSFAAAFYIPFYAGLAIGKHLWSSHLSGEERDRETKMLLQWVQEQEPWKRCRGCDHFMMLSRVTWDFRRPLGGDGSWGGSILSMPAMREVTRLLVESNPWDDKDVSVPFPTGFHPRAAAQVSQWQQFVLARRRSKLFGFAGAARASIKNDFRGMLMEECRRAEGRCGLADCGEGRCDKSRSRETVSLFLDSKLCLQPRGDSYSRKSMFDCMVAGAVPVVFWNRTTYRQYPWYLPEAAEEWSVFVDRKEVRSGAVSVRKVLEGIGEDRIMRMRERVVEFIPRLLYGGAEDGIEGGVRDAFDVAVDGVLRRFREQKAARAR